MAKQQVQEIVAFKEKVSRGKSYDTQQQKRKPRKIEIQVCELRVRVKSERHIY